MRASLFTVGGEGSSLGVGVGGNLVSAVFCVYIVVVGSLSMMGEKNSQMDSYAKADVKPGGHLTDTPLPSKINSLVRWSSNGGRAASAASVCWTGGIAE